MAVKTWQSKKTGTQIVMGVGRVGDLQSPSGLEGQGSDHGGRGALHAEDGLEPRGECQLFSLILQGGVVAKTSSTTSRGFTHKDFSLRALWSRVQKGGKVW